jgi:hypothetical protein
MSEKENRHRVFETLGNNDKAHTKVTALTAHVYTRNENVRREGIKTTLSYFFKIFRTAIAFIEA